MTNYDCIVIGGGPGGATLAALVAKAGYTVLVVERAKFPRFHIGESLIPETYWTFKRLGMLPRLRASNFTKKIGVQFIDPAGAESQTILFNETNSHESAQTWQVVRSEFDQMMLDNAAAHGAEVWQEAAAVDVIMEPLPHDKLGRAVGVLVSRGGQAAVRINGRVIVDACGIQSPLARKLGIRKPDPRFRLASIFGHYRTPPRHSATSEIATLLCPAAHHNGWLWHIPLPNDTVSIGVVGEIDRLITGRGIPEQTLDEEIRECRGLSGRMAGAVRIMPAQAISDFTWRASRCAGDNWVLIGDAFGYLAPILSSGVFLAMKSAEMAADCVIDGLAGNDLSGTQLGKWGQPLADGMQVLRKLLAAFSTPTFSIAEFLKSHPQHRQNFVELLVGDIFRPEVNAIFKDISRQVTLPDAILLESPPRPIRGAPVTAA